MKLNISINPNWHVDGIPNQTPSRFFLLSDPDELVDQRKLIVFEKVGGKDNPMLNKQIVVIVDKLLH